MQVWWLEDQVGPFETQPSTNYVTGLRGPFNILIFYQIIPKCLKNRIIIFSKFFENFHGLRITCFQNLKNFQPLSQNLNLLFPKFLQNFLKYRFFKIFTKSISVTFNFDNIYWLINMHPYFHRLFLKLSRNFFEFHRK